MNKDKLLTIQDAANHLALSPYTLKKMLRNGELDFVQINSRVKRIRTITLQDFINKKTIKTNEKKITKTQKVPSQCIPSLERLRTI
jgi:excisionase family DNA binding protein